MPLTCHNELLHRVRNDAPIDQQMYNNCITFSINTFVSNNIIVHLCTNLIINGSCSAVSNNLTLICHNFKCQRNCKIKSDMHYIMDDKSADSKHPFLNNKEINEILLFICCN